MSTVDGQVSISILQLDKLRDEVKQLQVEKELLIKNQKELKVKIYAECHNSFNVEYTPIFDSKRGSYVASAKNKMVLIEEMVNLEDVMEPLERKAGDLVKDRVNSLNAEKDRLYKLTVELQQTNKEYKTELDNFKEHLAGFEKLIVLRIENENQIKIQNLSNQLQKLNEENHNLYQEVLAKDRINKSINDKIFQFEYNFGFWKRIGLAIKGRLDV